MYIFYPLKSGNGDFFLYMNKEKYIFKKTHTNFFNCVLKHGSIKKSHDDLGFILNCEACKVPPVESKKK